MSSSARADVDLRDLLEDIVHFQGDRPVCVAMALSAAHEAARTSSGAALLSLAPEAIWASCCALGQTTSAGVLLTDAGAALHSTGQPSLANWPFDDSLGFDTEDAPASAVSGEWHRGQLAVLTVEGDGDEDGIEDALERKQAVVIVVGVTDSLYFPDRGVVSPVIGQSTYGYHAVTAVGASTHPLLGRCLLIKNSWGAGWGLGGYAWLPLTYLIHYGAQACCVATL